MRDDDEKRWQAQLCLGWVGTPEQQETARDALIKRVLPKQSDSLEAHESEDTPGLADFTDWGWFDAEASI